jgi:hypothetical protein
MSVHCTVTVVACRNGRAFIDEADNINTSLQESGMYIELRLLV